MSVPGVSSQVLDALKAKYSDAEILTLFSRGAHLGDVRLRYDKGNGDLTCWLPSSMHMYYAGKGWTAVELADEPKLKAINEARV